MLNKEELMVITNLYGINKYTESSLRDIMAKVGKSHERIRQIRDRALTLLRNSREMSNFKNRFSIINQEIYKIA